MSLGKQLGRVKAKISPSLGLLNPVNIRKFLPQNPGHKKAPGSVEYIGEARTDKIELEIIQFDTQTVKKIQTDTLDKAIQCPEDKVSWINIPGVHDTKLIKQLGAHFNIHPLILEDVVNTTHSPKIEDYPNHLFIVTKMAYYDKETHEIGAEQISIVIGKNYVITFQEHPSHTFDELKKRLQHGKSKVRAHGSDYLTYALIDTIVDYYFTIIEEIGERIEMLEWHLMHDNDQNVLHAIYKLKQEMMLLRRSIWPMREVINNLLHSEYHWFKKETLLFLRDVYDHSIQVVETIETFRDMASGLLELNLSIMTNHMNKVMKILTLFAAIFIPLTFIAGIYGMNFKFMPELEWRWGYHTVLAIMGIVVTSMLIFFKRRGWLK